MFLCFNQRGGNFSYLNKEMLLREITRGSLTMDTASYDALDKLLPGEYVRLGHFIVVGGRDGVTMDELLGR